MIALHCDQCHRVFVYYQIRDLEELKKKAEIEGWTGIHVNGMIHDFCENSCMQDFMSQNDLVKIQ